MLLFSAIAKHPPENIALQEAGYQITYGNLPKAIATHARKLGSYKCAAILMNNNIEWILWDLAALFTSTTLIPLPPFFTKEQREHAMQSAGCDALITPEGLFRLQYPPVKLAAGTSKVTFTSGTTGIPKGVCLSVNAMENVAHSIVTVLGKDMAGTHVSVLPLAVLLENVAGIYATLLAGGTVYLNKLEFFGENYANLHRILHQTKATSVILVPEILRILMAQVAVFGALPDLRYIAIGGSKVSPYLVTGARAMGLPVYEGYGLSECASVVSLNVPGRNKPSTSGKLLPHIKCKIKDGEITVRNTGFLGYVGEGAPDIIDTGDIGTLDTDGFLSITGRKKNVLITSFGRNVSPEWVESELLAQPEIAQAVVYGDAQPYLSAYLVPTSHQADIPGAVARVNARLPDYAQIKNFQPIPPLSPRDGTLTGTGRPRRSRIFQLYQNGEQS